MEFKDLEEAKAYIEAKEGELKDIKAQLENSKKENEEIKVKNGELVKTNSQLLSDIVNMKKTPNNEKEKDEDEIEDLFITEGE